MLNDLLIYFREERIEFWSKDSNDRLVEVKVGKSNYVPLFFFLDNDELSIGEYAKLQFEKKINGAYGDYWNNAIIESFKIDRFNSKYPFKDVLFFCLKEFVLKEIVRNYFPNQTFDVFLKSGKIVLLFDSFLNEVIRSIVIKGFIEIIGFDSNQIINVEYWDVFSAIHTEKRTLTKEEGFIEVGEAFGDLFFNLISKEPPNLLNRKTLKGRGNDPLLDTVLEYISYKAISRGSFLSIDEAKKELHKDGVEILGKLKEGFIEHKVQLSDISPFKLCFHSDAIISKLNNKSSLNFIQNEFDAFRNQNQIGKFKIFLSGEIVNSTSFQEFFVSTYSNVFLQNEEFEKELINKAFNNSYLRCCKEEIKIEDKSQIGGGMKVERPKIPELKIAERPKIPELKIVERPKIPELKIVERPKIPELKIVERPKIPEVMIPTKPQLPFVKNVEKPPIPEVKNKKKL